MSGLKGIFSDAGLEVGCLGGYFGVLHRSIVNVEKHGKSEF